MLRGIAIFTLGMLLVAFPSFAGDNSGNQLAKILEYKTTLNLTDSQVKKIEIVLKTTQQKMAESKSQADIRLNEIERFTSDWNNMNGTAVFALIKEYFKFLTDYKTAELEAVVKARAILDSNQLAKYQQLVSIESMVIKMESDLALR